MFQLKRIFLFVPISILIPTSLVAFSVPVADLFGIPVNTPAFVLASYSLNFVSTFLVYWLFARGVQHKPYHHSFIVLTIGTILSISLLSLFIGADVFSSVFVFDIVFAILVVSVATKLGYEKKDVV